MAIITPFRGVRYNTAKAGNVDDLISPPYDVINTGSEEALQLRNPYNVVRLDIAKSPGFESKRAPNHYRNASALLDSWLSEKVLLRDVETAFYPYDVSYRLQGQPATTRKGFVCLVKLCEFEERVVKPHEQTFPSVIQDRLELTRHCDAQFSPVFSFFSDRNNTVLDILGASPKKSLAEACDADGNIHRLSRITESRSIGEISEFFQNHSIYIADGHHRYATALAYRNELRKQPGGLASDDPRNFIMMCLCPMEDKGLSILPAHRLIRHPSKISVDEIADKLPAGFQIQEIRGGSREALVCELKHAMEERQQTSSRRLEAFGLYHPEEDRALLLSLDKDKAQFRNTSVPAELQDLSVVILEDLVISQTLELEKQQCEDENLIQYHSDTLEALDIAVKLSSIDSPSTQLLWLVNATTIEQVQNVSDAGYFMPHKATYFYPKLVTGLVFNVFSQRDTTV